MSAGNFRVRATRTGRDLIGGSGSWLLCSAEERGRGWDQSANLIPAKYF